jgi:methyl-accepting chemotaxis protein
MKATNLSQLFPGIRAKELILDEISSKPSLLSTYNRWSEERQKEFLDICTGNKGVKMFYDSYFKEILNPEYSPERLSDFLSTILKQKVTVKMQLPNDTTRLSDEMSLVITDIVVEMEDGTLANIEVQKLGYHFTGQRASCYSADLLLRQYKRIRDEKKEMFSYKDIAPVYTIVLMEKSPSYFHEFKDEYVHTFNTTSDTGLELKMLQNFIFIPVDIFLEKLHNNGIGSKLDAWLTFMGCDEPEYIEELITRYPEFKPMYDNLYDMCLNVERMMGMFSKELEILDRNTVKLMIDEYQETAEEAERQLDEAERQLDEAERQLDEAERQLDEAERQLGEAERQTEEVKRQAEEAERQLDEAERQLDVANDTIAAKDKAIAELEQEISQGITTRDNEKISGMLRRGKTPEEIADFCDYPLEQVLEVKEKLDTEK